MKITIAPTEAGLVQGQHSATIERGEDDLGPGDVVEMFAMALAAYGCDEQSIAMAFELYLSRRHLIADEDIAHC